MSAALYHLHASIGSRAIGASAGTRYEYLMREGIFAEKGRCAEDFVESISDNMPEWAQADPGLYWRMADLHERDKAVLFREVEFAIPHGIPEAERGQWAEVMAHTVAATKDGAHPFTLAVHAGKDGENWNAHVIVSERVNDGINRDPEKWFSRAANAKSNQPEKGGARKTREMQPTSWLLRQRKTWERIGNEALVKAGREERLDCRSYKDRGIEKIPQIHLGRKAHQMKQRGAQSDRVARYDEIEEANRLMREEREAAADLEKTTKEVEQAAAARQAEAARIAQQRTDVAWIQEHHPGVFMMDPEQAELFFRHMQQENTPGLFDKRKYTATELWEADKKSPEALDYRKAKRVGEQAALDINYSSRQAGYERSGLTPLQKLRDAAGFPPAAVKQWENKIAEQRKVFADANRRIEVLQEWWQKKGAAIYAEREKAQHQAVDDRLAEMQRACKDWSRREETIMPIVREQHAERVKQRELERTRQPQTRARQKSQEKGRG